MRHNIRIAFAVLVAAGGAGVGVWTMWRGSNANDAVPVVLSSPDFQPTDAIRTETRPDARSIDQHLEALRDAIVRTAADASLLDSFAYDDLERLASRVSERVRAILEGDANRVRELALEDGAIGFPDASALDPQGLAVAERWPDVWRMAPLNVDGVAVRPLRGAAAEESAQQFTGIRSRSILRARFPTPPNDAMVIEVAIPMRPRKHESSSRGAPVYVGVAYQWDRANERWIGCNISVYSDYVVQAPPPM